MNEILEIQQNNSTSILYDVIIVGAGPVGLFLASELALANCSVLVLEKTETSFSPLKKIPFGMRGLSATSIELLYRRGLFSTLELHKKIKNPHRSVNTTQNAPRQAGHFAGLPFYEKDVDSSRWKYRLPSSTETILMTEMLELETIFTQRAEELGVIIQRGVSVNHISQSSDSVMVYADNQVFESKWLVGCDGGRSIVRKIGSFEFEGTEPTFTGYTALVDIENGDQLGFGRHITDNGMYLQSQPGYIILQDFDEGAFHQSGDSITLEHLQAVLRHISSTDVTLTKVHQATTWTDRARQATTYRNNRHLLAGDAAHIHSPLGGQGLNLGLGDALNLGWKLAATIQNKDPEGLLDTYFTERYPVGQKVLDWSRAQVEVMKPSIQSRALRTVMQDLLQTQDGATYMAERIWGISLHYPLEGTHPLTGCSAPNFAFEDGSTLADWTHDGKGILLDFENNISLKKLGAQYPSQLRYILIRATEQLGLKALLIRPDGIVAWATEDDFEEEEVREVMEKWFVKG